MREGVGDGAPRLGRRRAIDIVLRTGHLGAMATVTGGLAFDVPSAALRSAVLATVATGAALLVSEATHSRHWVYQLRGVFALAHVAVLGVFSAQHRVTSTGAAVALVVGAVGSHLPRSFRKWSLRHRRVVD